MPLEEIRGVTYDFAGQRLEGWQAVQRLYLAGWKDVKELAIGHAVMMSESGRYLLAYHHNCLRHEDGMLVLDQSGNIGINSTDLGYCEINVVHDRTIWVSKEEARLFTEELFIENPDLARADLSAVRARNMYVTRKWQPWVAYRNGSYKRGLPSACSAVGNFLGMALVGDNDIVKLRGT